MRLQGLIRSAELVEGADAEGSVELALQVQGVAPGQPRRLVVPFALLLDDPSLDPEAVTGRGFEAEVEEVGSGRHLVRRITLAARMLRASE